jgi:TetR/AcrR family transcriptional regulator
VADVGEARPRSAAKRAGIIGAAMKRFAQDGYEHTRVADIAVDLDIAKGSIYQHFGSKEGLFLACYRTAVRSFPRYLDAPPDVLDQGFFEAIRYWLRRTEHFIREDWVPYRVTLIGNYGADLSIRREVNRFLSAEDPYGVADFVRFGIEREELREDVEPELIVSMLDWLVERIQDALVTEELDPGLFRHTGTFTDRTRARIDQFIEAFRGGVGARA